MPDGKLQLQSGFLTVGFGFSALGVIDDVSRTTTVSALTLAAISGKTLVSKAYIVSFISNPLFGPNYFSNYNIGSVEYEIDGVPYYIVSLARVAPQSLPAHAKGSFSAIFVFQQNLPESFINDGASLSLVVNSKGSFTGLLALGNFRFPLRGTLSDAGGSSWEADIPLPTPSGVSGPLSLKLALTPQGISAILALANQTVSSLAGWQHTWNAKDNPAFENKTRSLHLAFESLAAAAPSGHGFSMIRLTPQGRVTWSAVLSDGRKIAGASFAAPDGRIMLYSPISYPGGGSFSGLIQTQVNNGTYQVAPQTTSHWIKRPSYQPGDKDIIYPRGFSSRVRIAGGEFLSPISFFGPSNERKPLQMRLSRDGIASFSAFSNNGFLTLPGTMVGNKHLIFEPAQTSPVLALTSRFSASTGTFSGTLTRRNTSVIGQDGARNLKFFGLYIPNQSNPSASVVRGFFLLATPSSEGTTTPLEIKSGRFQVTLN
jgi:hypothetical protein